MTLQGTGGHCSAGGLTSVPLTKERKGWTRCVKHMGEKGSACRVLVGKPEEKRPLGGIRRRWENGIKVGLKYECRAWIGFIWLRRGTNVGLLCPILMSIWVIWKASIYFNSWWTTSCTRSVLLHVVSWLVGWLVSVFVCSNSTCSTLFLAVLYLCWRWCFKLILQIL